MSARTVGHVYAVRDGKQLRIQIGGVPPTQQIWPISSGGLGTTTRRAKAVSSLIAIAQREGDITSILLPAQMLPYDATLVTFVNGIKMLREGQLWDVYDVAAYGAGTDGVDALAAINACATAANANGARLVWHGRGTYTVSTNPTFPGSTVPVGDGASYSGSSTTIYSLALDATASGGPLTLTGNLLWSANNTYDIGDSAATGKPRDLWLGRNAAVGGTLVVTGTSTLTGATNVVGDFSVATNKFTVAAASGNTTVAGTLTAADNVGIAATKKFYLDGVGLTGDTYITEGAANNQYFYTGGNLSFAISSVEVSLASSTVNRAALLFWDNAKAIFCAGTAGTGGGDYLHVSAQSGVVLRSGSGGYTAPATEVARFTSGAATITGTLNATGTITSNAKVVAGTTVDVGARTNALGVNGANLLVGNGSGGYLVQIGRLQLIDYLDLGSAALTITSASTRTTIGANGAATALTANPVGYLDVTIGGSNYQIPYYNRGA